MSRLYLSNPCASFTTFAHGAAGASSARLSLRPLFEEGQQDCKTRADRAAGMRAHAWCGRNHRCRPGESRDPYAAAEIIWRDGCRLSLNNIRPGLWVPAFAGTTSRLLLQKRSPHLL